ncbi:unnamed protein product, partial [Owenia fusiformis]
ICGKLKICKSYKNIFFYRFHVSLGLLNYKRAMKTHTVILITSILTYFGARSCYGLMDWFFGKNSESQHENKPGPASIATGNVAFEMKLTDEKFLSQAGFKDLSALDTCHHQVVAELKSSCSSLAEEDIGKLAVQLLNCQLQAENRQTFPCYPSMTIGECTKDMDPTMWNSYQIVSNRARAICYQTRQQQFRMNTELTVNKMLHASQSQLNAMNELNDGQEKLGALTSDTMRKMFEGQQELVSNEQLIKAEQAHVQEYIAMNLKELTDEKALISSGNKALADMAEQIKGKLEKTSSQIASQDEAQRAAHEEILQDLANMREKARKVWEKIDQSSKDMMRHQNETAQQYQLTLENLRKVNDTINFLLKTVSVMQQGFDQKLGWFANILGGTGDKVLFLYTLTTHFLFALAVAVTMIFLHTPLYSRLLVLILLPLNAISEIKQGQSLSFTNLTVLVPVIVAGSWFLKVSVRKCLERKKSSMKASNASLGLSMSPIVPSESTAATTINATVNSTDTSQPESNVAGDSTRQDLSWDYNSTDMPQFMEPPHDPLSTPMYQPMTPMPDDSLVLGDFGMTPNKDNVHLVKRHLLETLDHPSQKRGSRSCSPAPNRSLKATAKNRNRSVTPVRPASRNNSRSSTPKKATCAGFTKAGAPCKLTCVEGGEMCYRHTFGASK